MVHGRIPCCPSEHARSYRRWFITWTWFSNCYFSSKQKLNTRSSTESEVVGVDDVMPHICWTRYFMEAQGYRVLDNIVFQDNKSSILLEKNGKASSGKRTKHINIRYFFITDRVEKGEASVSWCPTGEMIGDYATKPVQGKLFRKFRDQIMASHSPRLSKPSATTRRKLVWRLLRRNATGVCWEPSRARRMRDLKIPI